MMFKPEHICEERLVVVTLEHRGGRILIWISYAEKFHCSLWQDLANEICLTFCNL